MDEELTPAPDMPALRAALGRKTVKADCPFCGENDWATPGVGALIAGEDDYLPVLNVICMRCGFVRLHATQKLEGFLARQVS